MKIKYEINGIYLKTKCPYGKTTSINKKPVMVGSGLCKTCEHNVRTDKVFQYVVCICEDEIVQNNL